MAIDRLLLNDGTSRILLNDGASVLLLNGLPNLSYRNLILAEPGLVGYWRLDEDVGTYADSKGTNTGTVFGAVTRGVSGALTGDPNRAATFDGVTGYVSVPDDNAFSISTTGVLAVEFWAKSSSATLGAVVSKASTSGNQYEWQILASGTGGAIASTAYSLAGGALNNTNDTYPTDTLYHHVVVVFDYTGQHIRTYIDGAAAGDDTDVWSGAPQNGTGPINIGRRDDASQWYPGSVDEVAIYSTALSLDQVKSHYEYGKGRFYIVHPQTIMPLLPQ